MPNFENIWPEKIFLIFTFSASVTSWNAYVVLTLENLVNNLSPYFVPIAECLIYYAKFEKNPTKKKTFLIFTIIFDLLNPLKGWISKNIS